MALEKTNVPIALAEGIDTKSDPKQIQPGKFTSLENAVFLKSGEIRKRNGFRQYVQSSNFPMGCAIFREQLFLLDGNRGYGYSPGNSPSNSTVSYGPFDVGNVAKKVGVPNSELASCAVDSSRNLAAFVYQYNIFNSFLNTNLEHVRWSLHDLTTDAKIAENLQTLEGRNPKIVTNDDLDYYIIVFEAVKNIVSATALVAGVLYEIKNPGNTNWAAVGSSTSSRTGRFVATGPGTGSGTAGIPSLWCYCIPKNPASFNTVTFIDITSTEIYSGLGYHLSNVHYPKIVWSQGNTGANTSIKYFPLTYAALSSGLAPTVTISGVSCRVGASVASSELGGLDDNMIIMNDGTNIRTIVYDDTLSTVKNALRVAVTASAGDSFNGVVASFLSPVTANIRFAIFTTTTKASPFTIQALPRIQSAVITGSSTLVGLTNYIFGAAIGGTPFTSNASYFEPDGNYRNYLPIKMVQDFQTPTFDIYAGTYTSYLINFWKTNSLSNSLVKTTTVKFLDLNTTQTFDYASYPLYFYTHFPDYYSFVSGSYGAGSKLYALITDINNQTYLYSFDKLQRPTYAEIGNNLLISGGILRNFDGWSLSEHNFLQRPLKPFFGSTTSGSIGNGTYDYVITYEWRDASGQVHIGAPSLPNQIIHSSNTQVPIICSTLKLTEKTTQIWIGIYRANDGFLFYKLPGTGVDSNFTNLSSINERIFNDNFPQSSIIDRPLVYTVGGELDNACAPACTFVGTYKRRAFLVPSEDTNSYWYSKEITPTTADSIGTPVEFSLEFVQSVAEEDGKVTGLAEMDDKLIIFKTSGISVSVGNGPSPNGLNNDFTLPQRLATDTGCLYGRSIILSPLGLLFQSPKGFYLLDRSLSVSYIGAPIESYNSIECTSANLMYDRNEIWFALKDGKTIVFNYYFNQFSLLPSIISADLDQQATIYKGVYVIVSQVLKIETPGIYQDVLSNGVGSGYAMKVATGWMSFAQVQGFQRIYKLLLLGDYKSAHRLQLQVAVDFDDTVVQTTNITATTTPPYQYRFFMTRQKCESIKFIIQDLAPTSGSWAEAFTLSNMAMEVGIKRGLNKITAAKSVG
jgi:hypothetical protein